ncbi:MAG: hypothetical protein Q4E73_11135, partial [Lachnospiraceae bacterium]|nr:hypothetical protein [Lachnospiraceae bacterium]
KNLWTLCKTNFSNLKIAEYFFLFLLILSSGIIGGVIWLSIHSFAFGTVDWLLCFIGYPASIFFLSGILYLYNHA